MTPSPERNEPVDIHTFILDSYYDMREWFRIISRGILIVMMLLAIFAIFILIIGFGWLLETVGNNFVADGETLKQVNAVIQFLAFLFFGTAGIATVKKMGPFGIFKMIMECLHKEERRDQIGPDFQIGWQCKRCNRMLSNRDMQMLQAGAPINEPSELCQETKDCLHHWAKSNPVKE